MKICIYGPGAIGGFIGARLALAGASVSAVARGATLASLQANGFRLRAGGTLVAAPVRAAADPQALGTQELVIVAVKGPALAAVAAGIAPLLAPATIVLTAMNGVPWWFLEGLGGAYGDLRLDTLDPGGRIAAAIPLSHVVGCVLHMSCSLPEPGLVDHFGGNRLILGEPRGGASARLDALDRLFTEAGFAIELAPRIQVPIWYKLWGNMTTNPISALTGATVDRILDDPLVNRFCHDMMREAAAIGARVGCPIDETPEDRNRVTRRLGAFKTSMLQDVEAGKPLEIDIILAVLHEMGEKIGVSTPNIDALLGLTRLMARMRGLYPWPE
jgi:2-dehydropantoate 2-reductase